MGKEVQFKTFTPEEAIEQIKDQDTREQLSGCLAYLKEHLELVEIKEAELEDTRAEPPFYLPYLFSAPDEAVGEVFSEIVTKIRSGPNGRKVKTKN